MQWNKNHNRERVLNVKSQPFYFFFPSWVFFQDTDNSHNWKGEDHLHASLLLPTARKYLRIDLLSLYICDDCFEFLIKVHVITRLLLDDIYPRLDIRSLFLAWLIYVRSNQFHTFKQWIWNRTDNHPINQ